jgi:hypothetical protein
MNDPVKFITDLINLNLKTGPFITGSYMTWLLEKKLGYDPLWLPDDLDICCTNEEQFSIVKEKLQPLATTIKETNWLGNSGTYWTIDDFKFQAFVHPVTVQERLYCVDYTMGAIACDGIDYITNQSTMYDILNKVIRMNENIFDWPVESIMGRYKKYLSRGYIDIANKTLNRLHKIYDINGTI